MDHLQKNDRKGKRLGKKKKGDRKGESNDSPEIPDRGVHFQALTSIQVEQVIKIGSV